MKINAELKKPSLTNPLFLNAFASVNGRKEFNFYLNKTLSQKFSLGIYGHASARTMITDNNDDGFLDMPKTRQINLLKRLQYTDAENGFVGFLSLRFLNDRKKSGETTFNGRSNNLNRISWGSEIFTQRADASLKIGYVFPLITYQSIGFQSAYSKHNQESFLTIVSETQFEKDTTYISEKMVKPIMNLQPFIVMSTPNFLKFLNGRFLSFLF